MATKAVEKSLILQELVRASRTAVDMKGLPDSSDPIRQDYLQGQVLAVTIKAMNLFAAPEAFKRKHGLCPRCATAHAIPPLWPVRWRYCLELWRKSAEELISNCAAMSRSELVIIACSIAVRWG
jgi:hypothetical protein